MPFIVWGLLVLVIIAGIIKNQKKQKEIGELAKKNKFIEKNRAKYEQMISNNANTLSNERKEFKRNLIIYVILCCIPLILFFVTKNGVFVFLFPVLLIVLGLIFNKKSGLYLVKSKEMYNESAKTILKELDPNLEYFPTRGIDYQEYKSLYFVENCDRFSSEDMIINEKTGFCSSDITIESEHEDDDGHTYYSTEYDGSLAKIDIKDIGCKIVLGGLSKYSFIEKNFSKIMFEHDEFNKEFLCFTDNELIAYKILTPDIMEELVNVKKNTIGDINVRLINNHLYIRFSGTNGFDGREDSANELFNSVAVLEEIMKTMNKIKEIIERKNMD